VVPASTYRGSSADQPKLILNERPKDYKPIFKVQTIEKKTNHIGVEGT